MYEEKIEKKKKVIYSQDNCVMMSQKKDGPGGTGGDWDFCSSNFLTQTKA